MVIIIVNGMPLVLFHETVRVYKCVFEILHISVSIYVGTVDPRFSQGYFPRARVNCEKN